MNKRKARPARQRRGAQQQQHRFHAGAVTLVALCLAAIGLMAFWNRLPVGGRHTYTTDSDIWYVEDGSMEIAAPQGEGGQAGEPDLPTATPTATPSPTPTATPEAEEDSAQPEAAQNAA